MRQNNWLDFGLKRRAFLLYTPCIVILLLVTWHLHGSSSSLAPNSNYRSPHSLEVEHGNPWLASTGAATTGKAWEPLTRHPYTGESASKFAKKLSAGTEGGKLVPQYETEGSAICCDRWIVVTTIFAPSRTVKQLLALEDWCVVVVGDRKTPVDALTEIMTGRSVFLSWHDQEKLPYQLIKVLPWNHFGRKNVGYLFAIHHCAKEIYDTDDDNELINSNFLPSISHYREISELKPPSLSDGFAYFNPYPYFATAENSSGVQASALWPRGYPLNRIKLDQEPPRENSLQKGPFNVAVLQSLANLDPDMDALYRLTQPLPITFNPDKQTIALSKSHYAPMNAQALIARRASFFGLLLPHTVHGRVTDIWRSYIWQRLLRTIPNGRVAFAPPWVEHRRNEHSYDADFAAEIPLYMQTTGLIRTLENVNFTSNSNMAERMMTLYIACYEVGLLEEKDLELVRAWLLDLTSVGYQFPLSRPLTFWQADAHDGTRVDVPSLLLSTGQRVVNAGAKGNSSYYEDIMFHQNMLYPPVAPLLMTSSMSSLTESEIRDFFEYYQNDEIMRATNAFFCSFPMALCEAYMPFNRSIIFLPAHRYSLTKCSTREWKKLNEHLQMAVSSRPGSPRHFVAAMGRYDQEYIEYFTGITPMLLEASSLFYTAGFRYTGTRKEILVGPLQRKEMPFESDFKRVSAQGTGEPFQFITARTLYGKYSLQNIADHQAVVLLPYAVLSYGMIELYAMGIPLLVPSLEFILELDIVSTADRRMRDDVYCGPELQPPPQHPRSNHPYSPEDDSREATAYWLQFADFYQWPHITYFDSWDDLVQKLTDADYQHIHELMMKENVRRKERLLQAWEGIYHQIDPQPRNIPGSYEEALRDLWDVPALQDSVPVE